jgi:predicted ATPase
VALFVDRAQRARPDFQLTGSNAAAVAEICRRLEGIPLAIELAAAWAKQIPPAKMLQQLARRFDLLVARQRDLPSRHQTLRAAMEWSYQLLSPELQRFFSRLFVFRGGFTAEGAAAVSGAPRTASRYLTQLHDGSLLLTGSDGGEIRYRLLETLREYGAEQLSPEIRVGLARRHAAYFLALAEAAAPELGGAHSAAWLDRMEREHDNFRAALEWFVESGVVEAGCRLGAILARFWSARGYVAEGRERLATLLAQSRSAGTAARAEALTKAGGLAYLQGDYTAAEALLSEGLAIAREVQSSSTMIGALHYLADVALARGDNPTARACYEDYLGIAREAGDQWSIATGLTGLGVIAEQQRDLDAAQALYQESVVILRAIGAQQPLANALNNLGSVAGDRGDHALARLLLEQALAIGREQNNQVVIVNELYSLGLLVQRQGNASEARAFYEECLMICREIGYQSRIEGCLWQIEQLSDTQAPFH